MKTRGVWKQEGTTAGFCKMHKWRAIKLIGGTHRGTLLQSVVRSSDFVVPTQSSSLCFLKITDFRPHLPLICSTFRRWRLHCSFSFFLLLPAAQLVLPGAVQEGPIACALLYTPSSSQLSRIFVFIMFIVSPDELKLHPN